MTNTHKTGRRTDDEGYEVGYAKPPKASRFKNGESGNPQGRPKKNRRLQPGKGDDHLAIAERILSARLKTAQNSKTKYFTRYEAILLKLQAAAFGGDSAMLSLLNGHRTRIEKIRESRPVESRIVFFDPDTGDVLTHDSHKYCSSDKTPEVSSQDGSDEDSTYSELEAKVAKGIEDLDAKRNQYEFDPLRSFDSITNRKVTVVIDGKRKTVSNAEASLLQTSRRALEGNKCAIRSMLKLAEELAKVTQSPAEYQNLFIEMCDIVRGI